MSKANLTGPCGQHGQYKFYRGLAFSDTKGTRKTIALGEFFFVKISSHDDPCLGELQLLWEDKNNKNVLSSVRLYFLPEQTPDGRQSHHGEHEVVAASEKVVLKLDDLVSWITDIQVDWVVGLIIQNNWLKSLSSCQSLPPSPPYCEASKWCPVMILSYPQYCRYRALLKRVDGFQANNNDVTAINKENTAAINVKNCSQSPTQVTIGQSESIWTNRLKACHCEPSSEKNNNISAIVDRTEHNVQEASSMFTRILFCRDTFEHDGLLHHDLNCDHLAPKLKGRPRKKGNGKNNNGGQRCSSPDSNTSDDSNAVAKLRARKQRSSLKSKSNSTSNQSVTSSCSLSLTNGAQRTKMKKRKKKSKRSRESNSCSAEPTLSAELGHKCVKNEKEFLKQLYKFMEDRNTPIQRIPHLGFKKVDLYYMYTFSRKLGGYDEITTSKLWKKVYDELGGDPRSTSAATCTRRHYERLLLPFEKAIESAQSHQEGCPGQLKNKAKKASTAAKSSVKNANECKGNKSKKGRKVLRSSSRICSKNVNSTVTECKDAANDDEEEEEEEEEENSSTVSSVEDASEQNNSSCNTEDGITECSDSHNNVEDHELATNVEKGMDTNCEAQSINREEKPLEQCVDEPVADTTVAQNGDEPSNKSPLSSMSTMINKMPLAVESDLPINTITKSDPNSTWNDIEACNASSPALITTSLSDCEVKHKDVTGEIPLAKESVLELRSPQCPPSAHMASLLFANKRKRAYDQVSDGCEVLDLSVKKRLSEADSRMSPSKPICEQSQSSSQLEANVLDLTVKRKCLANDIHGKLTKQDQHENKVLTEAIKSKTSACHGRSDLNCSALQNPIVSTQLMQRPKSRSPNKVHETKSLSRTNQLPWNKLVNASPEPNKVNLSQMESANAINVPLSSLRSLVKAEAVSPLKDEPKAAPRTQFSAERSRVKKLPDLPPLKREVASSELTTKLTASRSNQNSHLENLQQMQQLHQLQQLPAYQNGLTPTSLAEANYYLNQQHQLAQSIHQMYTNTPLNHRSAATPAISEYNPTLPMFHMPFNGNPFVNQHMIASSQRLPIDPIGHGVNGDAFAYRNLQQLGSQLSGSPMDNYQQALNASLESNMEFNLAAYRKLFGQSALSSLYSSFTGKQ
ncbi:AT-rich interactive domain-containing protein 5B [Halotydeus destructor]|nr:AT-rich interactive domain-containing protein 5B [Halotydeus destructor]